MKINKNQIKAIVKECLIEILNEGLAGSLSTQQSSMTNQNRQTMADSRRTMSGPLPERRTVSNNGVQQAIVKTAAGGNPLLESIFADTMQNSYRDMIEHESMPRMPKTGIQKIVDESTPEQIFGEEAASRWLAIMDRVGND
jgi:hypothetical protein